VRSNHSLVAPEKTLSGLIRAEYSRAGWL
jgi:hypothetical protein